jgi:2-oxoglutarate ferredoxin oxidoreductase subunit alpha
MVKIRKQKIDNIAYDIPELKVDGSDTDELLILSWGSTYGAIKEALRNARKQGYKVAHAHLTYLNPFPRNIKDVLDKYEKVLIPELNTGQLALLIKGRFLKDVIQLNKVKGRPFKVAEIENKIYEVLGGTNGN